MSKSIELVAFDLGNVLCKVDEVPASKTLAELSDRPWQSVHEIVFGQDAKNQFERNQITFSEHAVNALAKLGIDIPLEDFTALYDSVLTPSEDMFPLVSRVAEQHRIALVSNTSEPHWYWAERTLPFIDKLNPVITSFGVGAMKPDPAFYEALLRESGIAAEDILFIDDLPQNIDGARKAGMHGHQFVDRESLELELQELGVI